MTREVPKNAGGAAVFGNLDEFTTDVYTGTGKGELRLITRGRRSRERFDEYANAVQTFDWQGFIETGRRVVL